MLGLHTEYKGVTTNPGSNVVGQSGAVWQDCDLLDSLLNRNRAFGFRDHFTDGLPTGKYTATQATAGTFALLDQKGGVARAAAGSTTAGQGINVQLGSTVGELFIPTAGEKIFAEFRIKASTISTGPEFFIGLAQIDTTLVTTGTPAVLTSQAIGFKSLTGDGIVLGTCKDGSSETTASSIHTLVDGSWVNLGFVIDGTSKVYFYVNGTLKGSISANIPATELTPTIVCQTHGTTSPTVDIDWWDFVQQLQAY